jgi:glycosyltransferase involved in cell wall biosynthesis/GR25 family glycosyltransferase involved in LPS biosynthesis
MNATERWLVAETSQSIVGEARRHFEAGRFEQALASYERLAGKFGKSNFAWNIEQCRKKIGTARPAPSQAQGVGSSRINEVFDAVYLVNLPQAVEKRLSSAQQLRDHGIKFHLVEAVNGYAGEALERYKTYQSRTLGDFKRYPEYRDAEIKRGKPYIESAGAIGYIHTYVGILKAARDKGLRRILILEDDVLLCRDFEPALARLLQVAGDDWKVLQLGASQYRWDSVDHEAALQRGAYFPRRLDTCGSFAIAFDASVYEEVIEAVSAFESPFDHLALGEIYERHLGQCHVAYPNIVMPDVSTSSIRGGRDQHKHAEKMRWDVSAYAFPLRRTSLGVILTSPANARYLKSFMSDAQRPYDLRLFIHTRDGLRPLHNPDLLALPCNAQLQAPDADISVPGVDAAAVLDPACVLTESLLESFVQARLLGHADPAGIRVLPLRESDVVRGRVSVIMPTYMRPDNLALALESVLSQDYFDTETIVVSDNPADSPFVGETQAIVDRMRERFPERLLRFVQHQVNRNGAAARNTGLLASTGEYICFLDDDDAYLPGRISRSVAVLDAAASQVGGVYCGFLGWNSPVNDPARYRTGDLTAQLLLLEYKQHYLHTNTATYRRDALLAINGFDETYRRHQDLEVNLRFFERYQIGAVPEALVRLNPMPSTVSNKVFNMDIIRLKEKFLSQFAPAIAALGEASMSQVFERHWSEVARYLTDVDAVEAAFRGLSLNGSTQVLLRKRQGS